MTLATVTGSRFVLAPLSLTSHASIHRIYRTSHAQRSQPPSAELAWLSDKTCEFEEIDALFLRRMKVLDDDCEVMAEADISA